MAQWLLVLRFFLHDFWCVIDGYRRDNGTTIKNATSYYRSRWKRFARKRRIDIEPYLCFVQVYIHGPWQVTNCWHAKLPRNTRIIAVLS
jgi:hypothetical protein